ncbi:hypothetical protein [Methylorubrum extorquens]
MKQFALGFLAAYGLAAIYFGAMLSMPGVTTPPGAAPILALAWPAVFRLVF